MWYGTAAWFFLSCISGCASVICFFIWNIAIGKLGAGRTALFGNLIPVFSSIGAVFFLNETFTWVHIISMIIVFAGILLANLRH
ncbi:MAG: DMT family transporter [Chitinophagaceae bacterium]|nr:DMT family transporter [Chitinophagaceae bacterium]